MLSFGFEPGTSSLGGLFVNRSTGVGEAPAMSRVVRDMSCFPTMVETCQGTKLLGSFRGTSSPPNSNGRFFFLLSFSFLFLV
jgi:hypothetical protein